MIKITINVEDSIDKISIDDLIKWRNQVIRCFDVKNIAEIELVMQKKHFVMIERERVLRAIRGKPIFSIVMPSIVLLRQPDYFFGMKVIVIE